MRTTLVATIALLPAAAFAAPIDFFAEGAGSAELSGTVAVPLLRGVDTNGRAAVLAAGPEKEDRDEFLLTINLSDGPNQCTEAVVGALGGWVKEMTVAKQSSLFGATIKTVVKGANIPELYIGDMVVKDVHCEVHAEVNSLSLASTDVIAGAILPSKGEVQFVNAAEADTLLNAVGNVQKATRVGPSVSWYHGRKVASTTTRLEIQGSVFGAEGTLVLSPHEDTYVSATHERPSSWHRSGVLWTAGDAKVGDVALQPAEYLVFDGDIGYPSEITAVLGHDALYATDIAVDAASSRVAVANAKEVKWTDVGKVMLDDAKKNFDKAGEKKDASASLLHHGLGTVEPGLRLATSDGDYTVAEQCVALAGAEDGAGALSYSLGAADCGVQTRVERASEGEAAGGEADDSSDDSGVDKKEAGRQTAYAKALDVHGEKALALKHAQLALEANPDACENHLTVGRHARRLGQGDLALRASQKAAELYDPWGSLPLETRLDIGAGKGPANAPKKQSGACAEAWADHAWALAARGSWSKVDAIYEKHMDLSSTLAKVTAVARLADDRADEAHGVAIQALNVGGRGQPPYHAIMGLIASRTDRVRLAQANIDRLFTIESDWTLESVLSARAIATESGGAQASKAVAERLITERPYSASAWLLYGYDAKLRGDAGAIAAFEKNAVAIAESSIDRSGNEADTVCAAAALYSMVGESEAAAANMKLGSGSHASDSCMLADAVTNAVSGDSASVTKTMGALAARNAHLIAVLNLIQTVPAAPAPEEAPEK